MARKALPPSRFPRSRNVGVIQAPAEIPEASRAPRTCKYPWQSLDVAKRTGEGPHVTYNGPFFTVEGVNTARFTSQAYAAGRRYGRKFSIRRLSKPGEPVRIGVWRIE